MTLPLAQLEGKYEILLKIKEGGMGAIYKVRHLLLDEIRVVKVMRPQLALDDKLKRRFINEAKLAKRLRTNSIAQLYDFSIDDDGVAYIVMEYIDGVALQELLAHGGAPSVGLAIEIARQGLQALSCLHHEGMIHRDIAADNLMLTKNFDRRPLVKLIDLGIAKDNRADASGTAIGTFLGKARYSAPEQFSEEGSSALGARSDLYSFGVLLYELLTAKSPIGGTNFSELVASHLFRPPRSFDETDPEARIDPGLRTVVLHALEKDPANRMASAEEFADLLAPYQGTADARDELARRLAVAQGSDELSEYPDPGSSQSKLNKQFVKGPTPSPPPFPSPVADESHEKKRQVTRRENEIGGLISAGKLDEAESTLDAAVQELGSRPVFDTLRQALQNARLEVRERQRRKKVKDKAAEHSGVVSEIKRLVDSGDVEQAEKMLAEAERARSQRMRDARRASELVQQARNALEFQRLSEARERIAEALKLDPTNEAAKSVRQQITDLEQRVALDEACGMIANAIASHRFDEAVKQLAVAEGEFGRNADLAGLRARLAEAREQQREKLLAEVARGIEKLLASGEVDDAQRGLDAAIKAHGRQLAFDTLRTRIDETRRKQEHRKAVAQEVASIEALLGQGKLDRAGKQLEISMSLYGEDPDFVALRSRLDAAIDEHEHMLAQQRAEQDRKQARQREDKQRKEQERQKAAEKSTTVDPGPDSLQIRSLRKRLDEKKEEQRHEVRRHAAPSDDAPVDRTVLLPSRKLAQATATATAPTTGRGPLIGITVAAAVIVIAVAAYFLWPTPPVDPVVPVVVNGNLVLDAWPWAEVTSIVDSDGNARTVAAATFTPVNLSLEPGSYTVSLSHGDQPPQQVRIEIRSSETTEKRVSFAAPDADAYFKLEGW